jgi:hypothetical protein
VRIGADVDLVQHVARGRRDDLDRGRVAVDTHGSVPLGMTWTMSGLPPTLQVATTFRDAKSMTEIVPARRCVT